MVIWLLLSLIFILDNTGYIPVGSSFQHNFFQEFISFWTIGLVINP